MSRPFRAVVAIATAALGAAAIVSLPTVPAIASARQHATPTVTVVASGLNSPKHITFGPGGLYVTESGTGGTSCVSEPGGNYCAGPTGAVDLVNWFGTHTVLSGLPSVEGPGGAGGPAAVTFDRGKLAVLFQDTLVNPDGTTSVPGPGAAAFGKLALMWPFFHPARWSYAADIAAFAAANPQNPATMGGTPGETPYDSDPYDIIPYRRGFAIADAAANDVLYLSCDGHLSVLARLPTVPEQLPNGVTIHAQAVPTSLAVSPDGTLYAGTLRGVPSAPGTADVYRIVPGQKPVAAVTGLTAVSDIAFDHEGRLLVLEYNVAGLLGPPTDPGALLRVSRSGNVEELPITGLSAPTGLAVGPDNTVYVANHGNSAGAGEVLRITGLG